MKTLLLMLIIGICALALRSPDLMHVVGLASVAQDPAAISAEAQPGGAEGGRQAMSMEQFASLARTDPHAYRRFIQSHQVEERGEVNKLLNFFARGKYE